MTATTTGPGPARARRTDPHRRERIVGAALQVLAEHGVAGTTHRRVAAVADVPLGSTTYHFASLADLRAAAYRCLAQRISAASAAHLGRATTTDELVEALTDHVLGDAGGEEADWSVTYELYLEALREPALREVTEEWMGASRQVLEHLLDPATARGVDALVGGLVLHRMLSTAPMGRDVVRESLRRLVEPGAAAHRPG